MQSQGETRPDGSTMGARGPGRLQREPLKPVLGVWAGNVIGAHDQDSCCAAWLEKGWLVLSVTGEKVLMKLSHVLWYSRQVQIMLSVYQTAMEKSWCLSPTLRDGPKRFTVSQ